MGCWHEAIYKLKRPSAKEIVGWVPEIFFRVKVGFIRGSVIGMDKGKSIAKSRGGFYRIHNNDIEEVRSKVRILLCDSDPESCQEVLTLLCKCSYQVTSTWSARDAVNALTVQGPHVDIILAEVYLLVANGAKILTYITQNAELKLIPLIIYSTPDQVCDIGKCLKYGAVDYLVKPLRENELLNLWMHIRIRSFHGASSKRKDPVDMAATAVAAEQSLPEKAASRETAAMFASGKVMENCRSSEERVKLLST